MSSDRCHHIKTSGAQCGSPALRGQRLCYYHHQFRPTSVPTYWKEDYPLGEISMPEFEDAHSVQFVIRQVFQLMLEKRLDHKTASLALYALQIASSNLKRMALETPEPDDVCTDPDHPKLACGDSAINRIYDEQDAAKKRTAQHKAHIAALSRARLAREANANQANDKAAIEKPGTEQSVTGETTEGDRSEDRSKDLKAPQEGATKEKATESDAGTKSVIDTIQAAIPWRRQRRIPRRRRAVSKAGAPRTTQVLLHES